MHQQVQSFRTHFGVKFTLINGNLNIESDGHHLQLTRPPVCEKIVFRQINIFYAFLQNLPHRQMFLIHKQYLFISSPDQMIILKLQSKNSLSSPRKVRQGQQRIQKIFINSAAVNEFKKDTGFLNGEIEKKGNCTGLMVSIYEENRRYTYTFQTCHLIAFNVGMFNNDGVRSDEERLEYRCLLVSSFLDEVNRNMMPMVEYGSIRRRPAISTSNLGLCQIEQSEDSLSDEVGYMALKSAPNLIQSTNFQYEKRFNQENYGLAFWNYDLLITQRFITPSSIHIDSGKICVSKNKQFIRDFIGNIKRLSLKGEQNLLKKLFKYYDKIHSINLKIVQQQLLQSRDNNEKGVILRKLAEERELSYYKCNSLQLEYLKWLSSQTKQTYLRQKQQKLRSYSKGKINEYSRLIDAKKGTQLKIDSYHVYRRTYADSFRFDLANALAGQLQAISPQFQAILKCLKEKELLMQYYLLSQFYLQNHLQLVNLNLPQLMLLEAFAYPSQAQLKQSEALQLNASLTFRCLQNQSFKIRPEMQYYLEYEDQIYIYRLDLNFPNQQNKKYLLEMFEQTQLYKIFNYFKDKANEMNIVVKFGFVIINNKKAIKLKRFKKPILANVVKPTALRISVTNYDISYIRIKDNLIGNWKSKTNAGAVQDFKKNNTIKVFCFYEDTQTKQLALVTVKAYLIGINGIICPSTQIDLKLLSTLAYSENHKQYFEIREWVHHQTYFSFWVGLINELTESINYSYFGIQQYNPNIQYEYQYIMEKLQFNQQKPLLTKREDQILPCISASHVVITEIKKSLSRLSNFQIYNQKYLLSQICKIAQQIFQEYDKISVFESEYENKAEFKLALEGRSNIFFTRRNEAIAQYGRVNSLNKRMYLLIQGCKEYCCNDIQQIVREELIRKYQQKYQLSSLTLTKVQLEWRLNKKLYDEKADVAENIQKIQKQKQRLEKMKSFIQAHILNRFLEDIAIKDSNVEQRMFLIDEAVQCETVETNTPFYRTITQSKLPRVAFQSILSETSRTKYQLCNQIKTEQKLQGAFNRLLEKNPLQYEKVTNNILNAPITNNQKIRSWQILIELYQNINLLRPLSSKQKLQISIKKLQERSIGLYESVAQSDLKKSCWKSLMEQYQKVRAGEPQYKLSTALERLKQRSLLQYERVMQNILNGPISQNQILQILIEQYQRIKVNRPLTLKQKYMKYLFHIYTTCIRKYPKNEYYLLGSGEQQQGNALSDNSIRSRLTQMQLIDNYSSSQQVQKMVVQFDIPGDQKWQITDFYQKISENEQLRRLDRSTISQIRYFKNRQRQQHKIELFIESLNNVSLIQTINQNNRWTTRIKQRTKSQAFISLQNFDFQFNYTYNPFSLNNRVFKKVQMRGGYPFYQASNCIKLALKVINKYDNNYWLRNDGNPLEWPIAYHGLSIPLARHEETNRASSVIRNGLMQGRRNLYQNQRCLVHSNEDRVDKGIYFSPSFKITLEYANETNNEQLSTISMKEDFKKLIQGSAYLQGTKENIIASGQTIINNLPNEQKYSIVFMSRLNPDKIHIFDRGIGGQEKHLYWVVNKRQYSRTYAVILMSYDQLRGYPRMSEQFGETFKFTGRYRRNIKSWIKKKQLSNCQIY